MLVKQLIEKHGTNNAFQIAIQSGIKINYEPLGKIYGYYCQLNGKKYIHIGDEVPWYHREFTVAHLLFHALTKKKEHIIVWKNRFPDVHIWSNNEKEGIEFAIKLLFEATKLLELKSYRELCLVRGCDENEYQDMKNEILENINIDVENMSLREFFDQISKFY